MNVYLIRSPRLHWPTIIASLAARKLYRTNQTGTILNTKAPAAYCLFETRSGQDRLQHILLNASHTPILLDLSATMKRDIKSTLKESILLPGPEVYSPAKESHHRVTGTVAISQLAKLEMVDDKNTIPAGDPPRKIMVVITSGEMVLKQVQFLHSLNYKQLQVAGDSSDLEAKQGRFFYVISTDRYTEFIVALTKAAQKQNYIVYDATVPDESNFETFKDQILKMTPLVATITSQDQIVFYRNIVKSPLFTRDQRHAAEVALIEWDKKQPAASARNARKETCASWRASGFPAENAAVEGSTTIPSPLGEDLFVDPAQSRAFEFNKEPAPRTKVRLTNKFGSVLIGTFLEKRGDRIIIQTGGRDYSIPDTISTLIEEVSDLTPDIPPKPRTKSVLDREIDMLTINLDTMQPTKNLSLDQVLDTFGVSRELVDQYKTVPEADLIKYLNAGWEFVKELSGQKFLIVKQKEESK